MPAKEELIDRLRYLDSAASLPELIDIGIAQSEHNSIANLLRKGLSIVAFNILEDFVKNKANESLDILAASGISFANLPTDLQEYSISGALSSLNFQSSILKKDNHQDYKLVIQQETQKIASTIGHPYNLSRFSLLSSQSNVVTREVNEFLKAFAIPNGWAKLKSISDAIGGGIPDLAQAFNLAAQRRHSSAHSASFYYNQSWLSNLKSEILSICASIDIVITARCRQANRNHTIPLANNNLDSELNYRFLEMHGSIFKETKTVGGRSLKNWTDLQTALTHHSLRIVGKKEFVIILDARRRIMDWLA